MLDKRKKYYKNPVDLDLKFYVFVWIVFAIAAILCIIRMSIPALGTCFMLAGLAVLLFDLIYFYRVRFMAFWLIVLGGFMALPDFYALFLKLFSKIYSGDDYMQVNIFSAIILYAFLSVVDGSVDFIMRKIRCKHQVSASAYETNYIGRNENGKHVNKSYTVVTYEYNGKNYKLKTGEIREERGMNSKRINIYIDKRCPAYARTGQIQAQNIASIIRGVIIIWLIVVIFVNG